ncbi:MFS general substrate transporter [Obba rivulosa]|uniref:MFS general substrate transporter n=1 Tax=Obba rivulosa TaxID=1052685 RepID=A0A8E2ATR9_9APHY|nr:MFS general substrate transporter [Obba rivulosa]
MTGFSALPLAEDGGEHDSTHLAGVAKIIGPKWSRLPAITIGLLGVQVLWSIEMSYGTPYLISLGLSKSAVAMVFLAGPLSGLIVQPLIGVLADNSKSRFGRRRPYILASASICVLAMLLLGFTRPFASIFTRSGSVANDVLTIILAILALFSIDFSINAVQAVDRALLVDTLPSSEQADGNAWAARMLGIGSVAGYFIGNVDLTSPFSFLGDTELEVLSVIGSFLLVATHCVTAYCTKERVVIASKGPKKSFIRELKDIWVHARTLPSVIRQICLIQFFAWVGWFPVLFYTTAFIGELHKRSSPVPSTDAEQEFLDAEATRLGSRALFYSSILSLTANIILPFFVREAKSSRVLEERLAAGRGQLWWQRLYEKLKVDLATLWAVSHLVFAVCMTATFFYSGVFGATIFTTLTGFSWSITQWAPFSLLAEAILTEQVSSGDAASIMLLDTRTGRRSGDMVLGADEDERQFLVGDDEDENENDIARLNDSMRRRSVERDLEEEVRSFRSSASIDSADGLGVPGHVQEHGLMRNVAARMSHLDVHGGAPLEDEEDGAVDANEGGGLAAKAGIVIGIHNIFIVMPQFIMTGIASIIFAIVDPGKSALGRHTGGGTSGNSTIAAVALAGNDTMTELYSRLASREDLPVRAGGPSSYAIIFRLGGIAVTIAFVLTIRLGREIRHRWH